MSNGSTTLDIVSEICRVHNLHAKVYQDDGDKIYIFDCLHWPPECSHMLRLLLPNAILSVESSASSLSRFVVVVTPESSSHKTRSSRRRMLLAVLLTALIYALLVFFPSMVS